MTFFIYSFPIEIATEFITFIFTYKKLALPRLAAAIILTLDTEIMSYENEGDFYELL